MLNKYSDPHNKVTILYRVYKFLKINVCNRKTFIVRILFERFIITLKIYNGN